MSKKPFLPPRHVLVPFTSFATLALAAGASATVPDGVNYGKVPLHFEVNQGQTHEDVKFLSRGVGYSLHLTATEAVLVLAEFENPARGGEVARWIVEAAGAVVRFCVNCWHASQTAAV